MLSMAEPKKRRKRPAFAQQLADERKRRDITQTEAARIIGVTQRAWARYEAGYPPSEPVAILLRLFVAQEI